jgi:alanine-glyoxylate transaminase/serine-glyoxylate transaminase/serine-pyruvate transaminase
MAALSGIEMGLDLAGIPHQSGGVMAAMTSLRDLSNTRENAFKVAMA